MQKIKPFTLKKYIEMLEGEELIELENDLAFLLIRNVRWLKEMVMFSMERRFLGYLYDMIQGYKIFISRLC